MSTPAPPKPAPHHAYKSWTTTYYEHGKRHFKRFGKVDETTKAIAHARYREWFGKWQAGSAAGGLDGYTVRELCVKYAELARKRYVKGGKLTSHIDQVEHALNALITRHGADQADAIGAPQITKLRDSMAHSTYPHGAPRLLSTYTVNGRLRIIKQMYRWARSQGMVSREAAVDVSLTEPIRANSGEAKRPKIVKPVPMDIIQQTLAACPKTVADMIRVQMLTGMRSGEMCDMRPCDIDATDKACWVYAPRRHKMEHKGKTRTVYIGKQAQKILKPYIAKRAIAEPIFLPAESHRERLEMIGFPEVMAYQLSRSTFKPGRAYDTGTYRNAVNRAADRVFDPKGEKREKHDYSHRWHPHQLRHNFATATRESSGVEAASALLGHSSLNTTEIYAERSEALAKATTRKVG